MTMIQATVQDEGSRWVRILKPVGQGVVSVGVQKTEARSVASAILEGVEGWAVNGQARTTTLPALMGGDVLTITTTRQGSIRLAYQLPDGEERYMHLAQAEAADVALALVELTE